MDQSKVKERSKANIKVDKLYNEQKLVLDLVVFKCVFI